MAASTPKRSPDNFNNCPIFYALNILSKKWLIPILCELSQNRVMRFNDFMKSINGITGMMLTQSLKELQNHGLVSRIQYNEMPLRVEYSLTDTAKDLMPSLYGLVRWSAHIGCPHSGDEACANVSCPGHNLHSLTVKEAELRAAPQCWDSAFTEAADYMREQHPEWDPLTKLQYLFEHTLKRTIEVGEELSRLRSIYYVIGEDRSDEFLDPARPAFAVLKEIIQQGRDANCITDSMTDDEIIFSFLSYKHGLCAYWELERGRYDILTRNRAAIAAFINGFRK